MPTFFIVAALTLFLSVPNSIFPQNQSRKRNQAPISSKMNAKQRQSVEKLEKLIPRLMKDADVPGLSVALISNGEVFWQRGFGVKNVETHEPITDDTVFEAASLSNTTESDNGRDRINLIRLN